MLRSEGCLEERSYTHLMNSQAVRTNIKPGYLKPISSIWYGEKPLFKRGFTGHARIMTDSKARLPPTRSVVRVLTKKKSSARKHAPNQTTGGVQSQLARNMRETPRRLPPRFRP